MSVSWSMLALAGLWGGVACTTGFILQAFPSRDLFLRGKALAWGGAVVACFLAWMIGMANS
ncbi:MAG TPA: hypothetical protein VJ550_04455 [Geomonas sp.]|nr:hypothetical protein [Geomonas sp.]